VRGSKPLAGLGTENELLEKERNSGREIVLLDGEQSQRYQSHNQRRELADIMSPILVDRLRRLTKYLGEIQMTMLIQELYRWRTYDRDIMMIMIAVATRTRLRGEL
jgi:hypothetical protein